MTKFTEHNYNALEHSAPKPMRGLVQFEYMSKFLTNNTTNWSLINQISNFFPEFIMNKGRGKGFGRGKIICQVCGKTGHMTL